MFNLGATHAVQQQLTEKCRDFEAAFVADHIARMVQNFYAPDATLEGAELSAQHGRDAIERVFAEARASYSAIRINLDPVVVAGDTAYGGITNINMLRSGAEEVHRGVMIWQRIDESWFVRYDFFFTQREDIAAESLFA